jgi:hypothetical protein
MVQRDSIELMLHTAIPSEGGRMGVFCLLYLLCMLPFPVPPFFRSGGIAVSIIER